MERIIISIALTVILIVMLNGACARKTDGQGKSETEKSCQSDAACVDDTSNKAVEVTPEPEPQPEENLEEAVQQVLADISQARVHENTDELQESFDRLGVICDSAFKTQSAMLTAKYTLEQAAKTDSKGDDNGNR